MLPEYNVGDECTHLVMLIIFSEQLCLCRLLSVCQECKCCCAHPCVYQCKSDSTKYYRDAHIEQHLKVKIITNSGVSKYPEYRFPFSQSLPGCLFLFFGWRFSFLFQSHHFPEPLHYFSISNLCSVFEFLSPNFLLC